MVPEEEEEEEEEECEEDFAVEYVEALFTQICLSQRANGHTRSRCSILLMRLSLGRGAGARPSAARHRGGAWSAAALPSAPLARTGAVAAPPAWVAALELSETVLDESAAFSISL